MMVTLGEGGGVAYVGRETYWIAFVETQPSVHHSVVMKDKDYAWDPKHEYDFSHVKGRRIVNAVLIVSSQ